MSDNTIADLLRQLDNGDRTITSCYVDEFDGDSEHWSITVADPQPVAPEDYKSPEPLSEGDCLHYLYHLIGIIEAGEKRVSRVAFDINEVEVTTSEDAFRKYVPDGVQTWTFTIEPIDGPVRFTKQE